MLNLNGDPVSSIDPSRLPYSSHRGAGPRWLVPLAIATSVGLALISFLSLLVIPTFVTVLPVLLIAAHLWLFFLVRNATHIAIRTGQHDLRLDMQVINAEESRRAGQLSAERMQRVAQQAAEYA